MCVVMGLFLMSCSQIKVRTMKSDFESISQIMLDKIIDLISKNDENGLKKLFSKKALSDAESIDVNIKWLISSFKGEIKKQGMFKYLLNDEINHGKITSENSFCVEVTTTFNKYVFTVIYYPEDTINPDNQGVYALSVLPKEYWDKHFTYVDTFKNYPGVYNPNNCIPPK